MAIRGHLTSFVNICQYQLPLDLRGVLIVRLGQWSIHRFWSCAWKHSARFRLGVATTLHATMGVASPFICHVPVRSRE